MVGPPFLGQRGGSLLNSVGLAFIANFIFTSKTVKAVRPREALHHNSSSSRTTNDSCLATAAGRRQWTTRSGLAQVLRKPTRSSGRSDTRFVLCPAEVSLRWKATRSRGPPRTARESTALSTSRGLTRTGAAPACTGPGLVPALALH